MLLGQPDGRSIKADWGALASAKEFTLETEDTSVTQGSFQRGCQAETSTVCPGKASCGWEVAGGRGSFSPECGVRDPERFPLAPQHLAA